MSVLLNHRNPVPTSNHGVFAKSVIVKEEEVSKAEPESVSKDVQKQAAAFYTPRTATEVAEAVKYANANNLEPVLWTYQIDRVRDLRDAVVIDLQHSMRSIEIDALDKTVTFDASVTIGEVDMAAASYGLAVVGGTCAILRLGGVLVGGGYGYLTGQYGLVADNLISARVVLADGRLLNVSRRENQDLFWGIQGSYTNLGIITSFTVRAHQLDHPVYWAKLSFPASSVSSILAVIKHIQLSQQSCISLRVEISLYPLNTQIILYLFHNGPEATASNEFTPLLSLPNTDVEISMLPYRLINRQLNQTIDHNSTLNFCSTGINITKDYQPNNLETIIQSLLTDLTTRAPQSLKGVVLGIDYRSPNSKAIESPSKAAFAARHDGPIMYLRARWIGGADDDLVRGYVKDFGTELRKEFGLYVKFGLPGAYPGFCTQGDMTAQETFGKNYDRLMGLKKKYDPQCVFNPGILPVQRSS